MVKKISFIIPGEPVGKGRPKFTTTNGFARAYTPKKTQSYENLVKMAFLQERREPPFCGPVSMRISAFFSIPKSWPKKRLSAHNNKSEAVTKKPDLDNIIKIVADALNKLAYVDDSQIFEVTALKFYSHAPLTTVTIQEFHAEENT